MQFSRYIVVKAFCLNSEIWRFELQHLSSSPKEYADVISMLGLSGLEPPTSRLSGVRSNRLSYKPLLLNFHQDSSFARFHQVLWGNTIISFHSMRCAIFLNSNFALLVLIKKHMWRHPPTLPYRLQYSTIGRPSLNHRVRNGNGCVPRSHRHR